MSEPVTNGTYSDETKVSIGMWVGAVIVAATGAAQFWYGMPELPVALTSSLHTVLVGIISYKLSAR